MTATAPGPSAAVSRRSHSIRSAVAGGVTRWFPFVGSIGAWAVHLVALASLVRLTCTDPGWEWAMHAITAGTLLVTLVAGAFAVRLQRTRDDDIRSRSLGLVAVAVCIFNALLIVTEETLVWALRSQRCG